MAKNPFGRGGILDYLPQTGDQYQQFGGAVHPDQNQAALRALQSGWQAGQQATMQDVWANQSSLWANDQAGPDWGNGMAYAKAATDPAQTTAAANAVTAGVNPAQPLGPPHPTNAKAPDGRFLDQYGKPYGPGPTAAPPAATPPASAAAAAPIPQPSTAPGAPIALPGGWNAAGNKYQYNIPTTFQANANLFQYGYDPNQDAGGIDVGRGGQGETNLNRVYGWMNAIAKANGFSDISQMPQDKQAAAMNYAVGRLRTDSFNVDPSGAAWQRTGFAGYDKYLKPGATPPPAGTQPPAGVAPPPGTQPPGTTPPVGTQPPGAGPGPTGTPAVAGGDHQNAVNMALAGDESQQLRTLMRSIGIDPDDRGISGRAIQKTLAGILPAYMAMQGFGMAPGQGANPGDNLEQNIKGLGAIFNGSGGFNQALQQQAAQAKAQLGPGTWASQHLDEAGILQALGNITNLGTRGMNGLMQGAYKDYYDEMVGNERDYQTERIRQGTGYGNAADWLRQSKWADLLR